MVIDGIVPWTQGSGSTFLHYLNNRSVSSLSITQCLFPNRKSLNNLHVASQSSLRAIQSIYDLEPSDLLSSKEVVYDSFTDSEIGLSDLDIVDYVSSSLTAQILVLLLANRSVVVLSSSLSHIKCFFRVLHTLLDPFTMNHMVSCESEAESSQCVDFIVTNPTSTGESILEYFIIQV